MSVVYFLLLVGVLVAVHELGHFAAARALGIGVHRFSLGFGPALVSARLGATEYRVGAVPLGGYVRLYGEDPWEPVAAHERRLAFSLRPLWQRMIVVLAGPAANLAFPLFIYFFYYLGHTAVPAAVVGDVVAGSPAAAAGLRPGDTVLAVGGESVRTWEELERQIGAHAEESVRLRVRRGQDERDVYVTPRKHVVRRRDGVTREQGMVGVTQTVLPPRLGVLDPMSPAGRAGLETGDLVVSIDGVPMSSWTVLAERLANPDRRIPLAFLRDRRAAVGFADVRLAEAGLAEVIPDFQVGEDGKRRVATGLASAELFVARVGRGTPAERAGLRPGDELVALDGAPVTSWMRFEQALLAEPDRAHELRVRRARPGGGVDELTVTLRQERQPVRDEYGHTRTELVSGLAADVPAAPGPKVAIDGRVGYALGHAFQATGRTITEVGRGFLSLLGGHALAGEVGGPITMYRVAAVSGEKGWDYFLLMLAIISVNLGLLNLLPIPVLDGGHLLLFAIEGAARRRLPERVRELALLAGLVVLVAIAVLALRNDIFRYVLT